MTLLPSATEIVAAVGAAASIVGCSHECDYPAEMAHLPQLTRPRRELPRASAAIDRAVRAILEDALTVYDLDVARLRELAPDVVVTQDLCDVCAVSIDDVRAALREFGGREVTLVNLAPTMLGHVWEDVRRVGRALGREAAGETVATALEVRVAAVSARSQAAVARRGRRPRVLTIEWFAPVMVGGTWMPELVRAAGGEALVTVPGQHAPTLDRDALALLEPEVVLVKPCGFDLARIREELDVLRHHLPWAAWPKARVYLADGNAYFNRSGPRLVESCEILAACVHPETFQDFAVEHAAAFERFVP